MARSAGSRLAPPLFHRDEVTHRQLISGYLREAHQGHLGNVGTVTLATGALTTAVIDLRAGAFSFIGLMPTTANAAGALGTTYVSSRSAEGFTITHANTVTADRTFVYCILG
jgi:hypothetical protein